MDEQKDMSVESVTESEKVNSARKYDQREFLEDYAWTEKLYRAIIVVSCILAAASIGVAVFTRVHNFLPSLSKNLCFCRKNGQIFHKPALDGARA